MKQVRLEGSYYNMGVQLGEMIKSGLELPKASTERLDWVSKCVEEMEQHTPDLLDELQGLADGANLEIEQLNAVLLYEPFRIKQFPRSIPPTHHCTIFAVPGEHTESGEPLYARNYDFDYVTKEYFEVHHVLPARKLRSLLFTDHYVGGFGGVNEAGLACGITANAFYNGNFQPGILLNIVTRWVLDNCSKVKDAISFMERIQHCEGVHYLIADKEGTLARVETAPEKVFTTYAREDIIVATNHFQTEEMQQYQHEKASFSNESVTRLEGIINWYRNYEKPITTDSIKSILRDHESGVCAHNKEGGTVWSWIARLGTKEVEICVGSPCESQYSALSIDSS